MADKDNDYINELLQEKYLLLEILVKYLFPNLHGKKRLNCMMEISHLVYWQSENPCWERNVIPKLEELKEKYKNV